MPPVANASSHLRYWLFARNEGQGGEEFIGTPPPSKPNTVPSAHEDTTIANQLSCEPHAPPATPVPNTILDRQALLAALDGAGIVLKPKYIDYFYEHLHRQNYPSLKDFVQEYKRVLTENPADSSVSSDDSIGSPGSTSTSRRSSFSRYRRHRLPSKFLDFLQDPNSGFVTTTSQIVDKETSPNGNSTKIIIKLHDGLLIETHIMRYREHNGDHASVSVSSQVGCDVGSSSICPIESIGFKRNLTTGEILEQVVHAQQVFAQDNAHVDSSHAVRNVTFMASGEPLHNYDNVTNACHSLSNKYTWNLCRGRITISTVGITPRIYDLTRDLPNVIIALGLHAPNQHLRRAIIPIAQEYPLEELMVALDNHMNDPQDRVQGALLSPSGRKRRMVMLQYMMMEGRTSSLECAHELGRLCATRSLVVNLIPYIIHGDTEDKRNCPSPAHIKEFQSIVASYGAICNVRLNMSLKMSKRVARQMCQEKQQSFRDVPEDIEETGFWQMLSLIRFRGWNQDVLQQREKKRRHFSGVPREIVAKKKQVACIDNGEVSARTTVSGIIADLADSTTCIADGAVSSDNSIEGVDEVEKEITVQEEKVEKEITVQEKKDHELTSDRLVLAAALATTVFCGVMLYKRHR